ncbi:WXG100 family type VII secretion target [Streptomyces sp. NPDC051987]|uniref:WXG100 family type VII secretion target n=1 Tax=Streptomyces sp. NPDC051987 TaxID=3155808 RepID=UPI0034125EC4
MAGNFVTTQTAQMGSASNDVETAATQLQGVLTQLQNLMAGVAPNWQTAGSNVFFQAMEIFGQDLDSTIKRLINISETLGVSAQTYQASVQAEDELARKLSNALNGAMASGTPASGPR